MYIKIIILQEDIDGKTDLEQYVMFSDAMRAMFGIDTDGNPISYENRYQVSPVAVSTDLPIFDDPSQL